MKKLMILALFLVAGAANAATAFFTGNMTQVQTVTYQMAWRCEYNYNGQIFYRLFATMCPGSVEVQ